jgi:hypothetical protein
VTRSQSSGRQEQQVLTAMREIERYLDDNPNASDSIQGVRDWWLTAAGPFVVDVVQMALDRLVGAGVIEVRTVAGGRVIYGRRRESHA